MAARSTRQGSARSSPQARRGAPIMTEERLETPKQLAARVNLSEGQVRNLIRTGQLDHVMVGCRVLIPTGAFPRFLERNVRSCREETKDRDSVGSTSGNVFTSSGPTGAAAASARLARQTANKLKSSSRSGCSAEAAEAAPVILLRSL